MHITCNHYNTDQMACLLSSVLHNSYRGKHLTTGHGYGAVSGGAGVSTLLPVMVTRACAS